MAALTREEWMERFGHEVGRVAYLFKGRRLCPHLVGNLQSAVFDLLRFNMTSLVTVEVAQGFEVRIPGSWELLGVVDPWALTADPEGVHVQLRIPSETHIPSTLEARQP